MKQKEQIKTSELKPVTGPGYYTISGCGYFNRIVPLETYARLRELGERYEKNERERKRLERNRKRIEKGIKFNG